MSIARSWLRLVLWAFVIALAAAEPARAAAIRGVVLFAGTVEERKKLPVTIDQYVCGKEKDAEDLVVGQGRGIRNAVVWLQTPPEAVKVEAPPPAKVEMDQKGCSFTPRVVLVP